MMERPGGRIPDCDTDAIFMKAVLVVKPTTAADSVSVATVKVSNLRGSGEMEEAADMIILLYNAFQDKANFPAPFLSADTRGRLYVEVAKSRDGAKPSFLVSFEPSLTLISPLTLQEVEATPKAAEQKVIEFFQV